MSKRELEAGMTDNTHAVIIEDDKLNAKILETMLRQEGMTVTTIADPANAMAVLAQQSAPAVVFLDLEMPHLDGYEVLAMLRAQYGPQLPIAAYTVHTSELLNAMDKGFSGFFAKPINRAMFHANLLKLLNGEQALSMD
jgi:putative two-component system response regulator